MARNSTSLRRQRGAALVTGLLLLLILTILAISSMNAASVEFVMAGNEQFHQNAFQAAETGIAQTMVSASFIPNDLTVKTVNGTVATTNGTVTLTDNYNAQYQSMLGGKGLSAAIWSGMSVTEYSSYHFQINSTGTSLRNSSATNVQGVVFIAKADQSKQSDPSLPNPALN